MDIFETLDKSFVWITLINHGYVDYTKNFLISMKKANIDFKLVVYCIDEKSMEELSAFECICLDAKPFLKYDLPSDLKEWENIDYKRITFAKLDAIYYTLTKTSQLGVNIVGFIDTDIILLKDPRQIILDKMEKYKQIHLFSQCDEKDRRNGLCSNNLQCPMICSGVLAVRNIKEMHPLFLYNDEDVQKYTGDQEFLLHNFRKHGRSCVTIERNIFINGSYPGIQSDHKLNLSSACLIHFNWMVGHEKKKCMQKHGLWYV
jgi:hypothetical protein